MSVPVVITPIEPCNLCNLVQSIFQRLHVISSGGYRGSDRLCNLCNLFLGLNDARARARAHMRMRSNAEKDCTDCTARSNRRLEQELRRAISSSEIALRLQRLHEESLT